MQNVWCCSTKVMSVLWQRPPLGRPKEDMLSMIKPGHELKSVSMWKKLKLLFNPCVKLRTTRQIFDCFLPCDPFQASDPAVNPGGRKNPPPGCWGCWTPSSHGVWWRPHWSTGSWKWRTATRSRRICQSQPVPSPFQSPWEHLWANEKVRRWANEQNSSPFYWGKTKWYNSSYNCQHMSKDMKYL